MERLEAAEYVSKHGLRRQASHDRHSVHLDARTVLTALAPLALAYHTTNRAFPALEALLSAVTRLVDDVNLPLYRRLDEDLDAAMRNIKNRVTYERLEGHGPKRGPICQQYVG